MADSWFLGPGFGQGDPQCGQGVEKNEGCDHITCLCGAHWCWGCQRPFSEDIIDLLEGIHWECQDPCDDESEKKYLDNPEDYGVLNL